MLNVEKYPVGICLMQLVIDGKTVQVERVVVE